MVGVNWSVYHKQMFVKLHVFYCLVLVCFGLGLCCMDIFFCVFGPASLMSRENKFSTTVMLDEFVSEALIKLHFLFNKS